MRARPQSCDLLYVLEKAFGFNIIAPDVSDPTAAFSPLLQRRCSANGTAPWTVNPTGEIHGICEEGLLFTHANAGVMHYSTDLTPRATTSLVLNGSKSNFGVERLSTYRFLEDEVVALEDGGALVWRNNDPMPNRTAKCRAIPFKGKPSASAHPVAVRSYVWVYQWPVGDGG